MGEPSLAAKAKTRSILGMVHSGCPRGSAPRGLG